MLDPTTGREQHGTRPALVLSVDKFNHGPAELVVVLPITSKRKNIPSHVAVEKSEGGLSMDSYIKCEEVRCISKERLKEHLGDVTYPTLEAVAMRVRIILGL
jgi:mRNA interferase MazF